MIRVAVLGAGHWGPNLIRNFDNKTRSEVRWVVDLNQQRLETVRAKFPGVRTTGRPEEALADKDVDAVVVATPTTTHYDLVKLALAAGKHVLVEKPLTHQAATSQELTDLAAKAGRVLLVGHVFIYNPAIQWVKKYLEGGEAGKLYYISASRTNLGPIRLDVNAAWDLASHDISIFNYWLGAAPLSVAAVGGNWINPGVEDAVFATFRYPGNVLVHLHVSWLNPRKVRDITLVAERKMLTYDDMNLNEPVRIFDKTVTDERVKAAFVDSFASFRASIREGDIISPRVSMGEPLRNECEHFLDCIEKGATPLTGAVAATLVVKALEAMTRSMRNAGREENV